MLSAKGQPGLEAWTRVCFSASEWAQIEVALFQIVFKTSGKVCPLSLQQLRFAL